MEGSLVNKKDLQALYLSGTYCHKTSTRPPSCQLHENRLYIFGPEEIEMKKLILVISDALFHA